MKKIGYATTPMRDALWKAKRSSILALNPKVETDEDVGPYMQSVWNESIQYAVFIGRFFYENGRP